MSGKNKIEFIPFTKELHEIIVASGYTHIKNIGYLPEDDHFGPLSNHLDGYGLCIHQYENFGNYVMETENATITSPGAQYSVNAQLLKNMYLNAGNNKFYVYMDLTNSNYRTLLRKLRFMANSNKVFDSPSSSP